MRPTFIAAQQETLWPKYGFVSSQITNFTKN